MRLAGLSDRRGRGVRAPARPAERRESLPDAGRVDVRAHRRERVPAHRAVAGAASRPGAAATGAGLRRVARRRSTRPRACARSSSQRLARLDAATHGLLELAAVAGPEFDLDVIAPAAGSTPRPWPRRSTTASRSGMIEEVPGAHACATGSPTSWCGARSTTASPRARRAELHLRIAEALDERASDGSAAPSADLAHHFAAAAPIGGADRAVEYSLLAAAAAMAALAFDEAAVRAAHRARARHPGRNRSRGRDLLDLGAVTYRAGRSVESPGRLSARRPTSPASLGDGKLPATRRGRLRGRLLADGDRRPGRPRASRGGGGGARSGRLRAACARAGRLWPRAGLRRQARRERDGARRGDRHGPPDRRPAGARDWCSCRSYWLRGPTPFRDILDMLAEGRDIAQQLGDIEIGAEAFQWRIASLIAIGDLERRADRARGAARHGRADAPALRAPRRRAVCGRDRAVRRAAARGGGGRRAIPRVEPPARPGATRRASTASRCSASAASRAGSPSWRRRSGRSPSRTARRHGGPGSPRSWPSSG